MTTPQNCPKCGAKARRDGSGWYSCGGEKCTFATVWLPLADWNALRYVPATEEAGSRPRRMRGLQGPEYWSSESLISISHRKEHDENHACGLLGCQPVEAEPAAPDHIADAGKMVEPDPGDGWRLLVDGETIREGDEYIPWGGNTWVPAAKHSYGEPIGHWTSKYRRRVEPEQAWEDVLLARGEYGDLRIRGGYQDNYLHMEAPSLRGFMGFVYADGHLSAFPCRIVGTELEFPVAVRFAK